VGSALTDAAVAARKDHFGNAMRWSLVYQMTAWTMTLLLVTALPKRGRPV
jgi:hypothetical protein